MPSSAASPSPSSSPRTFSAMTFNVLIGTPLPDYLPFVTRGFGLPNLASAQGALRLALQQQQVADTKADIVALQELHDCRASRSYAAAFAGSHMLVAGQHFNRCGLAIFVLASLLFGTLLRALLTLAALACGPAAALLALLQAPPAALEAAPRSHAEAGANTNPAAWSLRVALSCPWAAGGAGAECLGLELSSAGAAEGEAAVAAALWWAGMLACQAAALVLLLHSELVVVSFLLGRTHGGLAVLLSKDRFRLVAHEARNLTHQGGDLLNALRPRAFQALLVELLPAGGVAASATSASAPASARPHAPSYLLVLNAHTNLGDDSCRHRQIEEIVGAAAPSALAALCRRAGVHGVTHEDVPVVLLGDLNADVHAPSVRAIVSDGGFVDGFEAKAGAASHSWTALNPLTKMGLHDAEPDGRIDHVLFRSARTQRLAAGWASASSSASSSPAVEASAATAAGLADKGAVSAGASCGAEQPRRPAECVFDIHAAASAIVCCRPPWTSDHFGVMVVFAATGGAGDESLEQAVSRCLLKDGGNGGGTGGSSGGDELGGIDLALSLSPHPHQSLAPSPSPSSLTPSTPDRRPQSAGASPSSGLSVSLNPCEGEELERELERELEAACNCTRTGSGSGSGSGSGTPCACADGCAGGLLSAGAGEQAPEPCSGALSHTSSSASLAADPVGDAEDDAEDEEVCDGDGDSEADDDRFQ